MTGSFVDVKCSQRGSVLLIEINRPEKRNAMRLSLRQELIEALTGAEENPDVSAVVVTGTGTRAFSAGADLSELQTRTVESELSRAATVRRQLPAIAETLSKPVIAAINGACLGAGLEFALGCTIRIAARTATFGMPEVAIGVLPGSGGSQRLTRIVGPGWSMHLTLTGKPINAQRAYEIGLVTGLCEPDELLTEALSLAEALGEQPRLALVSARDAINRTFDTDLATGIEFERKLFALCLSTGVPATRAAELLSSLSARRPGGEPVKAAAVNGDAGSGT